MADSPLLLNLPAELLLHILSYLNTDDLACVTGTCKALQTHSYDDQLWQPMCSQMVSRPITDPKPMKSFRDLYIAHHPHWFLTKQRIWFADSEPSGKLLVSRYDHDTGSIVGHAVVAHRGIHKLQMWEKDRDVIIHSFDPKISLDLHQPVLRLDADAPRTDDQPNNYPSDRGYAPPSKYSKEILMECFSEAGLYSSFMFCRALPEMAISEGTQLWPPLRLPAYARTRNESLDGFNSVGHRPTRLSEVSQQNFRLRKWVEYTGRRSGPTQITLNSPNPMTTALDMVGSYFSSAIRAGGNGGVSIRMPEDITTYATIPEWCYTPTKEKPWQGIWCGDYSGHGCEFLVIQQPDRENERPLPEGMDWLQNWFRGRSGSVSSESSYTSAQEELDYAEAARERMLASELEARGVGNGESSSTGNGESSSTGNGESSSAGNGESSSTGSRLPGIWFQPHQATRTRMDDYPDAPTGRLEAIKLTGDPNIPRGEYTFLAPDIGHAGFMRIADEEIFRGARVVRSAGHIAARGFRHDQYTPSQLIMISHNTLAQFWEGFGHISYYRRVNLDELIENSHTTPTAPPAN